MVVFASILVIMLLMAPIAIILLPRDYTKYCLGVVMLLTLAMIAQGMASMTLNTNSQFETGLLFVLILLFSNCLAAFFKALPRATAK